MNDLIALVTPASPVLGKALAGAQAPLALRLLGRAVLADEDATPDAIADALKSGDADAKLKIARAEADFQRNADGAQSELANLFYQDAAGRRQALVQLETVAANDRAEARQRQQVTNDRTNAYLAYIVTVGFLLTIVLVARVNYEGQGNAVLQTLLGVLGAGWASIVAFYFGSSVGSREKNALLGEANTPSKNISVSDPAANGGGK